MCHSEWDEESVIIVFVEHGIAYIGKSFGNSFSPWVICAEPLQVDLIFSGLNHLSQLVWFTQKSDLWFESNQTSDLILLFLEMS